MPDKCTLCGGSFEKEGKRVIFPYPPDHYLCRDCFEKSLDAGLNRLNKVLRGEKLTKEDWKKMDENKNG